MARMRSDEPLGRGDHRRHAALHVGGAAAVQDAVAYHRLERICLPFLARAGRHDIGMAREAQDRTLAAVSRPEILDRSERHPLDPKAQGLKALADQLQATMIFGADGRTADQFLGERQRRIGIGGQRRELQSGQGCLPGAVL
jgi:hypothetical protein